MTVKGGTNHYKVKFLKGYGFSIKVKDSKIALKNCSDPFKEPEVEEWFVNNMRIQRGINGFTSTIAMKYLICWGKMCGFN